jgi:predicted Zn-ribbon and HTH transcriptional regulator
MSRRRADQPRIQERDRTLRQAVLDHLERGPRSARELSALLHIRERDVIPHLEHLERSLRRTARRLVFEPAVCLSCDYRFTSRRRLTKPSACPRCRKQHIEPPVFRLRELG